MRLLLAGILALSCLPAAAATFTLTLTERLFDGTATGREWTGWMEIAPSGAVTSADISLPGLEYLYPGIQTYSLPLFGLFRAGNGELEGYLASAELPMPAPALLFESGRWYSGQADSGSAFACLSCQPRGSYVLAEKPEPVPLPSAGVLLATGFGGFALTMRQGSKRRTNS